MQEIAQRARQCAQSIIEDLGYELVDVEYVREDGLMCLNYYIYKPDGVTLNDCEAVSRAIEDSVEEADPVGGAQYCLCVCSPGDRPLLTQRDFERNIGIEVTAELKMPIRGKKKKLTGVLSAFDEKTITLIEKKETVTIDRENICTVRPYFGF